MTAEQYVRPPGARGKTPGQLAAAKAARRTQYRARVAAERLIDALLAEDPDALEHVASLPADVRAAMPAKLAEYPDFVSLPLNAREQVRVALTA